MTQTERMNVPETPDTWIQLACRRSVVLRSTRYAIVVGVLLAGINHGDAIIRGELTGARLTRILLTFVVPYGVATFSSVSATRQALTMNYRGGMNVDRERVTR